MPAVLPRWGAPLQALAHRPLQDLSVSPLLLAYIQHSSWKSVNVASTLSVEGKDLLYHSIPVCEGRVTEQSQVDALCLKYVQRCRLHLYRPSAMVTLEVRANTWPSCTKRGTARGCFSLVTLSASFTACTTEAFSQWAAGSFIDATKSGQSPTDLSGIAAAIRDTVTPVHKPETCRADHVVIGSVSEHTWADF